MRFRAELVASTAALVLLQACACTIEPADVFALCDLHASAAEVPLDHKPQTSTGVHRLMDVSGSAHG